MAVITEEQLFPSNVVCWAKRRASVTHVLWIILLPASILFSENKGPKVDLLFAMDLGPNFGIPADPVANEYRLRHVGRIPYPVFQVSLSVPARKLAAKIIHFASVLQGTVIALLTISALVVIVGIGIRIFTRHQPRLDDYFMLFGLLCLCGTAGLLLNITRDLFVAEAIGRDPTVKLTVGDIQSSTNSLTIYLCFRSLAWTTIVCVKFSFLALFRLLIRNLSKRIVIYFWFVVGCTLLAWLYMVTVDWLICRHTGAGPGKKKKPVSL